MSEPAEYAPESIAATEIEPGPDPDPFAAYTGGDDDSTSTDDSTVTDDPFAAYTGGDDDSTSTDDSTVTDDPFAAYTGGDDGATLPTVVSSDPFDLSSPSPPIGADPALSGLDSGAASWSVLDGLGVDENGLTIIGDLNDDLSGVNDIVGQMLSDGIPVQAVAGGIYDLVEGNYEGAAAEGVVGAADIVGASLGLPGIDGDLGVITDLVEDNLTALPTDMETAGIETATGVIGGTIGSVLGPVGTVAGAALGNFVGGVIAPSVEDAVSDTVTTGEDLYNDTEDAFSNAVTDVRDGNVVDGVGDMLGGVVDDVGDVATGAADVVGDAVEGVGDAVSSVGGLVTDVGDGVEDLGDDLESLF
jgi:hypothetical protein